MHWPKCRIVFKTDRLWKLEVYIFLNWKMNFSPQAIAKLFHWTYSKEIFSHHFAMPWKYYEDEDFLGVFYLVSTQIFRINEHFLPPDTHT